MATFERPDRRNRMIDRLYADLKAADTNATLQYLYHSVSRINAPALASSQLTAILVMAKLRDGGLDLG